MKKVVVSTVLGIALIAACPVARAEQSRGVEPRWGLRSERSATSSPLDLAHWLARRLNEGMAFLVPLPPAPSPNPAPIVGPTPNEGDEVCSPERSHCPTG